MTIIVLLILASMWVAVLLPSILRTREAVRSTDSVGDFRRQLWVLARTRRASIGMAYSSQHAAVPRRPVEPSGPDVPARAMVSDRAPVASPRQPVAWTTRQHTLRRRRDVVKALLTAITVTFLLGVVPGLRMAWGLSAAFAGLTVSYMAVLVHLRSTALERSTKVAFLDRHRQPEPALVLRRSAN